MKTRTPVQYGDFVRSESSRRRYWARSTVGWGRVAKAEPNGAHVGLSRLEEAGVVNGVITQNVDGLHHAAGSRNVIELHGSLDHVVCLSCRGRMTRDGMQERLAEANEDWTARLRSRTDRAGVESAPDGDAELPDDVHIRSNHTGMLGGVALWAEP